MEYKDTRDMSKEEVYNLYNENGWVSYVKYIDRTMLSIEKAFYVYSAWDNNKLVGLIRCVGDGLTILYIQDLLVLPKYQGKGIGSKLLSDTLNKFNEVYQTVLMTDDTEKTVSFYKKCGLKSSKETGGVAFSRMVY